MDPVITLFVVILISFFIAGVFFAKGLIEPDAHKKIKLSLYGLAFAALGYLGNHFLPG